MGGKVGKVLPLVAMAVATYFTAGAVAGAAGVGAGAGAGGAMSAEMLAAVATENALTGGLVASGIGAPAGLTAFQQATLALGAASAVNGIAGNIASAEAQKRALAIQAEQQRVKQLSDRLAITQKEAATQKNLRRVLAARTVAFNARGIDPGFGSPLALQEADYGQAADALDVLATQREVVNLGGRLDATALANRRHSVGDELNNSIVGNLLDFGKGTVKALKN